MIKELLRSKSTFATPIVLYLVANVGLDVFSYEYETVEEYLKAIQPHTPKQLIDRVNAALGLFTSNLFWTDPVVFTMVCRSLNRNPFPSSDDPSPGDITWGVTEAQLLYDGTGSDGSEQFSSDVISFVKYIFKSSGLYVFPQALAAFGSISETLKVADPAVAEARQNEADYNASQLDLFAARQTVELLTQIKSLHLPLQQTAAVDLDKMLKQYEELGITA